IDEIAGRSGVSAPVIYDHFASKRELHERLLERTRDELLAMWRQALAGDEPAGVRIPRAFDAWATYVETHPYAARMFFRETSGEPEVQAVHRRIQDQGRAALGRILGAQPGAASIAGAADQRSLEMAAEVIRAGLTGLAIWWSEHPEVPREQIVETAVNVLWVGFERVSRGEGGREAGSRPS
ncbi:MAG: TetR/AcrR family transcriptional regulator, partial [Solirubrobacteraceae bacterium]